MDGTSSALPLPQLKGAWGSGSIASRLAQAQNGREDVVHRYPITPLFFDYVLS